MSEREPRHFPLKGILDLLIGLAILALAFVITR
jgi:hypothetical protein